VTAAERLYREYVWARRRWIAWTCRLRRRNARPVSGARAPVAARRVLVVCTGLIGDTVMSTPAMAEARRLLARAQIVGLVNTSNRELLEPAGWFDDFLVYDGSPFALRRAGVRALRRLEREIRERWFDLALVLLGGDWTPLLHRCGIPVRVDSDDSSLSFLATHVYRLGDIRRWGPDDRLNALRCLGLPVRSREPRIVASERARDSLSRRLGDSGIRDGKPLVVFHPFGATPNRCLSPAKIAAVITRLVSACGVCVAVIGGNRALATWEQARGRCSVGSRDVCDLVGRLSVQEMCALVECADVVVSVDSGPMHIAGALERPTVGLFRAIRPEYAGLYRTVTPLFWEGGTGCLRGCSWDSWHGCRSMPCRQLTGIGDAEIVQSEHAVLRGHRRTSALASPR
jgi:ADP-heptose:LPS heptosyltransferase